MAEEKDELVVPVVSEDVHADAVPVETGGVRVIKRVEEHNEILEQELRKGRVEIRRIKTDRVVDGPLPAQRVGNTLIIPVVSEVLRVTKEWVVTEEIHVTQIEEREKFEQTVPVSREVADVERFDEKGRVHLESVGEQPVIVGEPISSVDDRAAAGGGVRPLARRAVANADIGATDNTVPAADESTGRKILNQQKSLLRDRK